MSRAAIGGKVFVVGVTVGHRRADWPLARFEVSPAALRVSCWPFSWYFRPRTLKREDVGALLLKWTEFPSLKIEDSQENILRITIHIRTGLEKIVSELEACGYDVLELLQWVPLRET